MLILKEYNCNHLCVWKLMIITLKKSQVFIIILFAWLLCEPYIESKNITSVNLKFAVVLPWTREWLKRLCLKSLYFFSKFEKEKEKTVLEWYLITFLKSLEWNFKHIHSKRSTFLSPIFQICSNSLFTYLPCITLNFNIYFIYLSIFPE